MWIIRSRSQKVSGITNYSQDWKALSSHSEANSETRGKNQHLYYPKHSTYSIFFTALHDFFVRYFNFFAVLPETFNLRFEGNALNLSQIKALVDFVRRMSRALKEDKKVKVHRLFSNRTRQFFSFPCLCPIMQLFCSVMRRLLKDEWHRSFPKG